MMDIIMAFSFNPSWIVLLAIFGIGLDIISIIICPIIAVSKGRSGVSWFFGALFFGIIALIIVACLSDLKKETEKPTEEIKADDEKYRQEKNRLTPYDEVKKLKELLDMGAISQEEFDEKKKQLFG